MINSNNITEKFRRYKKPISAVFLSFILVISLPIAFTGGAFASQGGADENNSVTQSFSDFEGGDDTGWFTDNPDISIVNEGYHNDYSLQVEDGDQAAAVWEAGPRFDMTQSFELKGTSRFKSGDSRVRLGVGDLEPGDDGGDTGEDRATIIFDPDFDETYLGTHAGDEPDGDTIDTDFKGEWVNWKIHVEDNSMSVKVWEISESEPENWQLSQEFESFEGKFYFEAGDSNHSRTLQLDQVDATDYTVDGRVIDSSGNPIPNATVQAWGVRESAFDEDVVDDLRAEAQELQDEIADPLPDSFEEFDEDFADGNAIDIDDWTSHLNSETDLITDDGVYPMVHDPSDWEADGGFSTTFISSEIDEPRLWVDGSQTVKLSVWDFTESGPLTGSPVTNSYPGAPVEHDIVIRQLTPGGEMFDERTVSTSPNVVENRLTGDIEWHTSDVVLSDGIYQVYPEGHPDRAYTFTVGNPDDIASSFQADLQDEVIDLEDRAAAFEEEIENLDSLDLEGLIEEGIADRQRTVTNENGEYDLNLSTTVSEYSLIAYKADEDITDFLDTDLEDASFDDIGMSDIREYRIEEYTGSVYLPGERITLDTQQPDPTGVDIEVRRSDSIPMEEQGIFEELFEDTREDFLDRTSDLFDLDLFGDTDDLMDIRGDLLELLEGSDALDELDDIDDIEDIEELLEDGLDQDRLESLIEDSIEDAQDEFDEVFDEDDIEAILDDLLDEYDGDGLDEDDVEQIIDDAIGDDLTDDEIEEIVEEVVDRTDNDELRDEINDLNSVISDLEDELDDAQIGDGDVDLGDDEIEVSWPVPDWVEEDDVLVTLTTSDGDSISVDDEYIDIEDGGLIGSSELIVTYPADELGEDVALADVDLRILSDQGHGSDSTSVQNPLFDGTVPEIDAVNFNDLRPGPNEVMSVGIDGDAGQGYDSLTDVEVRNAGGSIIDSEVDEGRDRATFTTDGEGVHTVRLTFETTDGDEITVTEQVKADDVTRTDNPTVRAGSGALGEFAVTGVGLETARIDTDDDKIGVTAVAEEDDAPGEVHLKLDDVLSGDSYEIDASVVEGSSEETVRSHVSLFIHFDDGIGEDTITWVNDQAITQDGDTRWGEVDDRDGDDKDILIVVTDERGQAELDIRTDPGILDRVSHWLDRTIPPLPIIGSLVGTLLDVAVVGVSSGVEMAADVPDLMSTPAPMQPTGAIGDGSMGVVA